MDEYEESLYRELLQIKNKHFVHEGEVYFCVKVENFELSRRVTIATNYGFLPDVPYSKLRDFIKNLRVLSQEEAANFSKVTITDTKKPVNFGRLAPPLNESLNEFVQTENEAAKTTNKYLMDMMQKLAGEEGDKYVARANAMANLAEQSNKSILARLSVIAHARSLQKSTKNDHRNSGQENEDEKDDT
jgi:hypothetical protein